MATGSILVAWHVAWSLDLYISSSLSSESELPGICCCLLGSSLVCAILAGLVSPTFSAGSVASLTACLISVSNYQRDHVLKEDAMALKQHHKSLEHYVQILEAIDVEQHGNITVQPEELQNAALRLIDARKLLDWIKARLPTAGTPVS